MVKRWFAFPRMLIMWYDSFRLQLSTWRGLSTTQWVILEKGPGGRRTCIVFGWNWKMVISHLSQPQNKNEGVIGCPNMPRLSSFHQQFHDICSNTQTLPFLTGTVSCDFWVSLSSAFKSDQFINPTIPKKFRFLIISHGDASEVQLVCVVLSL